MFVRRCGGEAVEASAESWVFGAAHGRDGFYGAGVGAVGRCVEAERRGAEGGVVRVVAEDSAFGAECRLDCRRVAMCDSWIPDCRGGARRRGWRVKFVVFDAFVHFVSRADSTLGRFHCRSWSVGRAAPGRYSMAREIAVAEARSTAVDGVGGFLQ